jgi:hypothetical protein
MKQLTTDQDAGLGIEADYLEAVRLRGRCGAGAKSHQLAIQKADPHFDRFAEAAALQSTKTCCTGLSTISHEK